MGIQLLLAILIGIIAITYVINRVVKEITTVEKDPKCEECALGEETGDSQPAP